MTQKPITLARQDYINKLCEVTNNSGLPAFVTVEVLEKLLVELRKGVELELKRDEAEYRKSLMDAEKVENSGENQ